MLDHPHADRRYRKRSDRFRRYRARRAAGRAVAPVEYDGAMLDLLITLQWLSEADAFDPRAVGAAIAAMLEDAAKRR